MANKSSIYVQGLAHTNTMENFWSLLKRGVIGQYHYVSAKHLNKYVDEFCFRYNNRDNVNIFENTIQNAVNLYSVPSYAILGK